MKNLMIVVVLGIFINNATFAQEDKKTNLDDRLDSLSYAIGLNFGHSIKSQQITVLNIEKLALAIEDVLKNNSTSITIPESQVIIQNYLTNIQEVQKQENLIKANAFLEENRNKEGVIVLPSGLQYKVLNEGEGESPTMANRVKTHYQGTLMDGSIFDSSYERGEPITFGINQVIIGWQEALQLMKPGSKWELYIHPDLGYGERPTGTIPANSLLIFEIELLSIE